MNTREKLIAVFQDTQKFYAENKILIDAVKYGKEYTALYETDDYSPLPQSSGERDGEIQVIKARSFEAAISAHKSFPQKKIAVLNFASATHPGGGVKHGSRAQEESLCRCSTLFPTIDRKWLWEKYYNVNRSRNDCRYSDACIYSPGVIICKTDEYIPKRMEPEDFVTVDVITCAAPNLRHEPLNWRNSETGKSVRMDPEQLYDLHVKRVKHILNVAASNDVDILILGAFGCGAFKNDPYTVAKAHRTALDEYKNRFDRIVFAIYCRDYETENFKAFSQFLVNSADTDIKPFKEE